jgi:Spy/CpxP family protein refolding chaperone
MSQTQEVRRRISPRAAAVVALVIVGALGGILGFALDRTVMSPCSERHKHSGERSPYWSRGGDDLRRRWNEISKSLNLTAEQSTRIDTVLSEQSRELDLAREQVEPRMKEIMRVTRARIDSVLTPDQKAQLEKLHRERESRRKRR